MSNKIIDIKFYEADSEVSKPIADATHSIPVIKFIVAELKTDTGITGQGFMLTFHYSENAVKGSLKDIRNFVVDKYGVEETEKLFNDYTKESEYFGNEGLLTWPLALINIAMWDAKGKQAKQPVWKLLNGNPKTIPVYGSGGWLSYSLEELIEEVSAYKKRGFKSVKVKVGSNELEFDLERVIKVREALGNDINIMIDANQGFDFKRASLLIKALEKCNIHWFEEPLHHYDFDGYTRLSKETFVSIAMGEREYNTVALKRLIELRAIDLWQPDIIRIGGVEKWIESAKLANNNNIPVLPHFYKDYDLPLLCTIDNGYAVESFDWIDSLIDNPLVINEGYAVPREVPGWGFNFLHDKMEEIKLD